MISKLPVFCLKFPKPINLPEKKMQQNQERKTRTNKNLTKTKQKKPKLKSKRLVKTKKKKIFVKKESNIYKEDYPVLKGICKER